MEAIRGDPCAHLHGRRHGYCQTAVSPPHGRVRRLM